jgi:type I restriction-modification system DNA methylase subunit
MGKIDIKEESKIRKSGGVYDIPQYILDYIVEITIGILIKDKSPTQISKLKILDPASGSGGSLLCAYDYLFKYHQE